MGKKIVRAQYRAFLKNDISEECLQQAVRVCEERAVSGKAEEKLLTAGLFRYEKNLFLYLEVISDTEEIIEKLPERIFPELKELLLSVPDFWDKNYWIPMVPVFWFDTPEDLDTWTRKEPAKEQCGRIALLHQGKVMSYIYHHQAIVREGLFVGDRYQFISLHENVLFSYYEDPRDREQVNVKKKDGVSEEIDLWIKQDPESHFYHFPEAEGANFLKIQSLFTVG